MSSTEAGGRQSPDPEDQSKAQVGQPAGGQGTDKSDNKDSSNKSDLDVSTSSNTWLAVRPLETLYSS